LPVSAASGQPATPPSALLSGELAASSTAGPPLRAATATHGSLLSARSASLPRRTPASAARRAATPFFLQLAGEPVRLDGGRVRRGGGLPHGAAAAGCGAAPSFSNSSVSHLRRGRARDGSGWEKKPFYFIFMSPWIHYGCLRLHRQSHCDLPTASHPIWIPEFP